ncbi:MAG: RluA family pseudouridine synthase [Spirochaetota bacterium]
MTAKTTARALTVLKEGLPQYSRTELEALFTEGRVRYDGHRIKKSERISEGGVLSVDITDGAGITANPAISLSIVFEDESIIAVNKPPFMHTVPLRHDDTDTLMNAVAAHCGKTPEAGGVLNAGSVNRLDHETTGLVLAAKSDQAFGTLSTTYRSERTEKYYLARVAGTPPGHMLMEDVLVKERSGEKEKMRVGDVRGLRARAELTLLARCPDTMDECYVLLRLITGVRHQLRVQLASRGYPIVGDALYGGRENTTMLLHSLIVETHHPESDRRIMLCAVPPEMFWGDG